MKFIDGSPYPIDDRLKLYADCCYIKQKANVPGGIREWTLEGCLKLLQDNGYSPEDAWRGTTTALDYSRLDDNFPLNF